MGYHINEDPVVTLTLRSYDADNIECTIHVQRGDSFDRCEWREAKSGELGQMYADFCDGAETLSFGAAMPSEWLAKMPSA